MRKALTSLLGLARRPGARLAAQVLVSLLVLALLVWLARQGDLAEAMRDIGPAALGLALALQLGSVALASRRWQLYLRCRGVHESWLRLTGVYLVGMFCSTFLPGSVGGDAVRVCELKRRGHPLGRVSLVTLQDRLLGLGVTMLIGLPAVLLCVHLLPAALVVSAVLVQAGAFAAIVALLYPRRVLGAARRCGRRVWGGRIDALLGRVQEQPPLSAGDFGRLVLIGVLGVAASVAAHVALARSVGISAGWLAFALAVPLVWVVKLLPVSLNGVGVGEGAFVYLLGLFDVNATRALAVALGILAVQTVVSLAGGLLLLAGCVAGVKSDASGMNPEVASGGAEEPVGRAA